MKLTNILTKKRASIIQTWFDQIIETYPPDTAKFLKRQKNRFANPVGATLSEGMEGIFDSIINKEGNTDRAVPFLDSIIRIRAIQDFAPSRALAFIFILKKIIRKEIEHEPNAHGLTDEVLMLEKSIDELALKAFDIYMECREKIYEIKANEVRNMTFRLLQRANLMCEPDPQGSDAGENNFLTIKKIKRKEANK